MKRELFCSRTHRFAGRNHHHSATGRALPWRRNTERGTLDQLRITAIPLSALVAGKLFTCGSVGLAVSALMLVLLKCVFGVAVAGNTWLLCFALLEFQDCRWVSQWADPHGGGSKSSAGAATRLFRLSSQHPVIGPGVPSRNDAWARAIPQWIAAHHVVHAGDARNRAWSDGLGIGPAFFFLLALTLTVSRAPAPGV